MVWFAWLDFVLIWVDGLSFAGVCITCVLEGLVLGCIWCVFGLISCDECCCV